MSNAPVCHIPAAQPSAARDPVNIPGIPLAQPNLQSLTDTVNRLRAALLLMTGQTSSTGRAGPAAGPGSGSGAAGGASTINGFRTTSSQDKKTQWIEQERVVEKERVFQNNDKTSDNWVDVERINSLTMRDKNTGQTWRWVRGGG